MPDALVAYVGRLPLQGLRRSAVKYGRSAETLSRSLTPYITPATGMCVWLMTSVAARSRSAVPFATFAAFCSTLPTKWRCERNQR
jgi:hypothetical protein